MDIGLKVGKKELIKSYNIALPVSEDKVSINIEDINIIFEFSNMLDDISEEKLKNWDFEIVDKTLTFKINRLAKKNTQLGTTKAFPRIAKVDGLDIYLGFLYQPNNNNSISLLSISLYRACKEDE
ncbi:hypothetical protein [Pectobacterium sp. A5351]|uniref:hypothetical protein n=1 Tax=Pectobacterium sp. A5351 TaxID=2914983 RepID=UPI0023308BB9|nr:hypothetical protein [Pectobacterium sp. A5351]WCG83355.1 hypothetical protein O1Q74_01175 [Pectobacterium sp. A5351]